MENLLVEISDLVKSNFHEKYFITSKSSYKYVEDKLLSMDVWIDNVDYMAEYSELEISLVNDEVERYEKDVIAFNRNIKRTAMKEIINKIVPNDLTGVILGYMNF